MSLLSLTTFAGIKNHPNTAMWILEYPNNDFPDDKRKTSHLLVESTPYVIGRSAHAQFHTNKKRISKIQFVISFDNHSLIVDNRGKGKFNLNGEYIPNGKCFKFQPKIKAVRNLQFSFRPEPFEFIIRYEPFVINDDQCVQKLKAQGYPAECSVDSLKISHYLVSSSSTFKDLAEICKSRDDPLIFITQRFIDALILHAKDIWADFVTWWPREKILDIYCFEDDVTETFAGVSNLHFIRIERGKVADLPKNALLWCKSVMIGGKTFQGLAVNENSIVLDSIKWNAGQFYDADTVKQPARTISVDTKESKRRKLDTHLTFSNLPTMANFGGDDDFEVIKTQESQHIETEAPKTFIEDSQSEGDKNKDEENNNAEKDLQPKKTEYLEVDMDQFASSKDVSGLDLTDNNKKTINDNSQDDSDSLLRVFQKAKATKVEQAKKDNELLDSLDKTDPLLAKVRKIKLTEFKGPTGPKRYNSAIHGLFGNSRWSNRIDYSKFRKISFTESNPITDSTVKGIRMKKASYNSDGLVNGGQVTNRGQDEMMNFNSGIKELDKEFQPQTRKRSSMINRWSKRRATKARPSNLFVVDDESDEDVVDDREEPAFFSRTSTQRKNADFRGRIDDRQHNLDLTMDEDFEDENNSAGKANEEEDDEDDIPTFRRRSEK